LNKKTIFLYVNQGFALRYLLRTDILRKLRELPVQIVILSHNSDEQTFQEAFEAENVIVEKFDYEACESYLKRNKLQRILISMRAFALNGRYNTQTVDDFRSIHKAQAGWTSENGPINSAIGFIWESGIKALKSSRTLRRLLIKFESRFFAPKFHEALFRKYSPDLVVVNSLCGFEYNEFMAREAKQQGVPVCCVALSWDNTSGMGMPGYDADHIVAWTENMKKELIELNDIDEKKIFVGGVAHFDYYYKDSVAREKSDLFRELKLDPGKKTLLFATKSPKRFPWGPELIAEIAEAIDKERIKPSPQLLVRIHPLHYRRNNGRFVFEDILNEYAKIQEKYPDVILNIPNTVSKKMDFDLSDDETNLIASLLTHSDVMLNMFSTMVIEAAIFDLPSINLCIREKCKADFGKSRQDIMIDYVQTHNNRVVQTGGVRTVFTMEDLFDTINGYLDDPTLDSKERRVIVENETGPFRGNAGETIANHIYSLVNN
jgi:hypothetical protein